MNYYKDQLDRLNTTSKYPMSVKFTDGDGNHTNHMSINEESIDVFIEFLQDMKNKNDDDILIKVIYNHGGVISSIMTLNQYNKVKNTSSSKWWSLVKDVYVPRLDWENEKVTVHNIRSYM